MSNVPAILGALVADGLSAIGVPGGSTAGEAIKGYLARRSAMATDVLLDEFRRAEIDAATAVAEDDRVAIIYRYLRASWEGSARVNLRLLAKAIVGRMQTNSVMADDFSVVELGRLDQGVDGGGPASAGIGAGEGPVVAADGDAAESPLGGVVAEAEARPSSRKRTRPCQRLRV